MEKELEDAITKPPEGVENLVQGEETIPLNIEYEIDQSFWDSTIINISINEIITFIGPLMFSECSEEDLLTALKDNILYNKLQDSHISILSFPISNFNVVKIQLHALGIIKLSRKKRDAKDRNTYWKLTPYGVNYVIKLIAVKKQLLKKPNRNKK